MAAEVAALRQRAEAAEAARAVMEDRVERERGLAQSAAQAAAEAQARLGERPTPTLTLTLALTP